MVFGSNFRIRIDIYTCSHKKKCGTPYTHTSDFPCGGMHRHTERTMTPRLSVSKTIQPSFSKVDTKNEIIYYRSALCAKWDANKTDAFPGCNPCSLGRCDLPVLHNNDFSISLKSDGVRYALFLTLRPENNGPVAILVDRSWAMYEVEVVAPEEYFTRGTILEGEMVWQQPDESVLLFLVFDAVLIKGKNLCNLPFNQRLNIVTRCTRLSDELRTSPPDDMEQRTLEADCVVMVHYEPTIVMRPKTFVELRHTSRMWNERYTLDHRVDGIILNMNNAPYHFGTARNGAIYKWKPRSTVDLALKRARLHSAEGPLPSQIHGRSVEVCQSRVVPSENGVVEYLIVTSETTVSLFPLRKRPDKTTSNSEWVVCRTIQDVIEQISVEELAPPAIRIDLPTKEKGYNERE